MSDRLSDATDKSPTPGAASDLSSVDILKEQPAAAAPAVLLPGFPQCELRGLEFNTMSLLKGKSPDKQTLALLKKAIADSSFKAL